MIVLLLFFCSGATALIYEVLWSKQLGLMLGSTIQAQTVVLAAFMGGLALGNRVFGRRADLLGSPLRVYGYVELAIGLYAFLFDALYGAADGVFVAVGGSFLTQPAVLLLLKAILGGGLVLAPTFLMGGTLPLLAAWLRQRDPDSRRLSARFYAINSLGAVAGAWLGGFVLLRELGVLASMQLAALVNVAIGFTALGLAKVEEPAAPGKQTSAETVHESTDGADATKKAMRRATVLVAFTGGVSMGLEVLASRSLALIFGPSLQAFATVLMAFILGIGVCSVVISMPAARRWQRAGTAPVLMLLAAVLVIAYVVCIEEWVLLYSRMRHGLAANLMGHQFHQILVAGMAIAVLGLPAGLLGTVLPLSLQTVRRETLGLGADVGRLLTWNTLGAVAGVLLSGFVFMPWLGMRLSFLLLAGLLALAVFLAAGSGLARLRVASLVLLAGAIGVGLTGGERWRHALGSGIFRARTSPLTRERLVQRRQDIQYLFYQDAADATVSVETWAQDGKDRELMLRINGKPDASTRGDLSTQYLLAHLPLLARPDAKEVFVLGFGSGITAGAALSHPIQRLTVAENCRPVLRAGKLFAPWNRNVLEQPRTRVFAEDARTLLKLDPTRYEVIISEPSNPWVAGIGGVFSREFYQLAASRLSDGGVMAQWFHVYEMHDGIVDLVLRTFASVFPHVEVWEAADTDIILLGSLKPWPATPEHYAQSFLRPWVREDLAAIGLTRPEALFARQLASQATASAITGDGAVQSDLFPVLEYEAPRAFFVGANATRLFRYDERTLQAAFAPRAKRDAAATLDRDTLRAVFRGYPSGNPDIRHMLEPAAAGPSATNRSTLFPSLFAPAAPNETAAGPVGSRAAAPTALALLDRNETEFAAWIATARTEVTEAAGRLQSNPRPDVAAAETAGRAASALIVKGRTAEATEWIALGRKLARDPEPWDYLERIAAQRTGQPVTER